jgi:hypothetical protein
MQKVNIHHKKNKVLCTTFKMAQFLFIVHFICSMMFVIKFKLIYISVISNLLLFVRKIKKRHKSFLL